MRDAGLNSGAGLGYCPAGTGQEVNDSSEFGNSCNCPEQLWLGVSKEGWIGLGASWDPSQLSLFHDSLHVQLVFNREKERRQ